MIKTEQRVAQLGRLRELIGEAAIDKLQVYLGASDYSDGLNEEKKRAAILDVEDRNDSELGELFAARVGVDYASPRMRVLLRVRP